MQYLLTEEERTALVLRTEYEAQQRALAWCFERLQPERCPHLTKQAHPYCTEVAAGGCPLDDYCDVDSPTYEISKLICRLSRCYGK